MRLTWMVSGILLPLMLCAPPVAAQTAPGQSNDASPRTGPIVHGKRLQPGREGLPTPPAQSPDSVQELTPQQKQEADELYSKALQQSAPGNEATSRRAPPTGNPR
jgi:hypothetical protein